MPAFPRQQRRASNFCKPQPPGNAAIIGLSQEVTGLKSLVQGSGRPKFRHKQFAQVPEELFDHYMQLIDNQVAEEIATELVKTVREQLRPEQLLVSPRSSTQKSPSSSND